MKPRVAPRAVRRPPDKARRGSIFTRPGQLAGVARPVRRTMRRGAQAAAHPGWRIAPRAGPDGGEDDTDHQPQAQIQGGHQDDVARHRLVELNDLRRNSAPDHHLGHRLHLRRHHEADRCGNRRVEERTGQAGQGAADRAIGHPHRHRPALLHEPGGDCAATRHPEAAADVGGADDRQRRQDSVERAADEHRLGATVRHCASSVVILEPEMRNQLLPPEVAERVLQLHQLNEQIMFRVEAARMDRALEIEG